jgi:hypothetical protein
MSLRTTHTNDKNMNVPNQHLKGALSDLKEIVNRSHGQESAQSIGKLIGQMESLVSDIEGKVQNQSGFAGTGLPAPVQVI